jgi:hypothetical protein
MHSMEIASTHRRNSGRKEGPMASSVSTITCGVCGHSADAPMRKANTDGTLRFACVGEHHEPHAARPGRRPRRQVVRPEPLTGSS